MINNQKQTTKKYFSFPCRESKLKTKEGRRVVEKYISDTIGNGKLKSVVREKLSLGGEVWVNFTVVYEN